MHFIIFTELEIHMNTTSEHTSGNHFLFLLVVTILPLQAFILKIHSQCAQLHDLFEVTSPSTVFEPSPRCLCVVLGEEEREMDDYNEWIKITILNFDL